MADLLDVVVRSSIVLALALVADAVFVRARAALRHALLAAALFTAAVIGPLRAVLPTWSVPMPIASSAVAGTGEIGSSNPAAGVVVFGNAASPSDAGPRDTVMPWAFRSVTTVWLVGVGLCVSRLLVSYYRLGRLARGARPLSDHAWLSSARKAACAMGVRRPVRLLETDSTDVLATWGIMRPRILVPAHARRWPPPRVYAVLCHEMTHVARCDWLVQSAADFVLALYWFNPLAWVVVRRLRAGSEHACDDSVLRQGIRAPAYARHLVEVARACRVRASSVTPALPVVGHTDLHRRIQAMLNSPSPASALSPRTVALIVISLVAAVVPLSALRVGAAGPQPLVGVVYDPTGAVVPGAAVTLGADGQRPLETVSDEAGRFHFDGVAPGRYVLAVALPGFGVLKQSLELARDGDWERSIILQLREVEEEINVRGARLPAPQPAAAPARVRVGGKIRPPLKLRDVHPVYPVSMRAGGVEGRVSLEAIIGRDGNVQSARVVGGLVHPDLAQAAIEAVRQWKFEPTTLNGSPVEVVMNVAVNFELEK
jgi:TonB family protein